jgi:AAT family amino acid transporter
MGQSGEAPKALSKTTKSGTPVIGIMITSIFILVGVFLAYMTPDQVIGYLMTIPGFTVMIIWICICAAQIRLRPIYKNRPGFQLKGYPYTNILAMVSLTVIVVAFMFNKDNIIGSIVCLVTVGMLIIFSFIVKRNK